VQTLLAPFLDPKLGNPRHLGRLQAEAIGAILATIVLETSMRIHTRFIPLLGLVLLLGPLGCEVSSTPTLPLPPPSVLTSAPDGTGLVTLSISAVEPGAFVSAFNLDTMSGVIGVADDAGTLSLQIPASIGDTIEIWQRVGTRSGEPVDLVVPPM